MKFKTFNLLVVAVVLLLSATNYYFFGRYVQKQIDQVLINAIRQNIYGLSLHINEHFNDREEQNMRILLDRVKASSREIAQLYIVDHEGRVLRSTDYSHRQRFSPDTDALDIEKLTPQNIERTSIIKTEIYKLDGLKKIPYTLYAKLDQRYIRGVLSNLELMAFAVPLVCMLLFLGGFYLFYRLVIRPILGLEAYINGDTESLPHARIYEIEDLSQKVQSHIRKLQDLAYIDPLTQVQNRRSIEYTLEHAIASANRDGLKFSVAILDLDHFKEVNDTYGHDIGDKLLVEMIHRIKTHLRQVDQIGRIGGDEFLIIFHHDENTENILLALERIRKLFEIPFVFDNIQIISTISVGVATYPTHADGKNTLLKAADKAMYRAKKEGGNAIRKA